MAHITFLINNINNTTTSNETFSFGLQLRQRYIEIYASACVNICVPAPVLRVRARACVCVCVRAPVYNDCVFVCQIT